MFESFFYKNPFCMKIRLLIISFLFYIQLSGQNEIPGVDYRACSTSEKYNEIINKNPIIKALMQQQNNFAQEWTKQNYGKTNATNGKKTISYIIPVVWHVIHNDGPENMTKEAIEYEIAQLNLDYQKLNADISNVHALFSGIVADCEIEFRLARIDPDGNCTEGITRTKSNHTYLMDDPYSVRPSWNTPTRKYLNIWQGKNISFGAGGYAYYPGTVPDEMEGIVLIAQQLGNTVTHEVGHWLNLAHLWGHSNDPQDPANCMEDDEVLDTPNTIGRTGCRDTANSCGSIDNVQNYMEYNFCDLMFTEGQKQRMHAALNSSAGARDYIVSQTNLINTGTADPYDATPICTPIADFNYNKTFLCEGEQVIFSDYSFNATPTSWDWTFNGGTPATSNLQSPSITYNTKGIYSVTYQPGTTNGTGFKQKDSILYVSGFLADYSTAPFSDSFEDLPSFESDWWIIPNANFNWENTTVTSATGNRSIMVQNISNQSTQTTEIISPSFDLTANNYILTYKYAHAKKISGGNDRLLVYYTTNCGKNWSLLKAKLSSTLATAPPTNASFVPTNTQWETDTINLSALNSFNNVKFKFHFRNGGGNNIWLDDVNIDIATSVYETENIKSFSIYPNPTNENAAIFFKLTKDVKQLQIVVKDLLGKEIAPVLKNQFLKQGTYTFNINQQIKLASGIYLIEMIADGNRKIEKLVVN